MQKTQIHFWLGRRSALLMLGMAAAPGGARAGLISSSQDGPLPPSDLTRIVCIGGAITEILYMLGAGGQIAGVDSTSLYPPEALKEKPDIGYMRAVPAEGVLALKPTLILASREAGPAQALKLLAGSPVPFVYVDAKPSAEAVGARVKFLARLLGRGPEGQALCTKIDNGFAALDSFRAAHPGRPRVLFVMSMAGGRPVLAGGGTAADAMIKLAGGENAAAALHGYQPAGPESLISLAPDAILAMDNAGPGLPDDVLSTPGFRETPAGRNGVLIRMDGEFLLGFGPRTPQAAMELAQRLAKVPVAAG